MSYNERRVNLNVNRIEVCDIIRATAALYISFDKEAKDATVPEERRKIAEGSARYWKEFRDKIKAQLNDFDKKNGF